MREALAAIRPANPRHPFPDTSAGQPKGLNVLGTLAHNPRGTEAYHTFTGHALFGTTLTTRQRELIVLRIAVLRDCAYEWAQHVFLAGTVGITAEEVGQVRVGPDDARWSTSDANLLRAVDELIADARVGDTTWAALSDELDPEQLLDVLFTVGTYETLAMVLRSFDVDLDADLDGIEPL